LKREREIGDRLQIALVGAAKRPGVLRNLEPVTNFADFSDFLTPFGRKCENYLSTPARKQVNMPEMNGLLASIGLYDARTSGLDRAKMKTSRLQDHKPNHILYDVAVQEA
jgi:hypothetical protein